MAQIFPKSFNWLAKITIVVAVFLLAAIGGVGYALTQSDYWTNAGVARTQPIQFSHAHHVTGLGIDCRYCHTSVENASFAGIPPTKTCMNCHQQIRTGAPMLEPVRESYKTGKALEWERIHRLGDFVYFDHSIHVNNGVGCTTCHGRVDQMQAVFQKNSLLMNWCLECHRAPEKYIRPKDQVFTHDWDYTMARKHKDGGYWGTATQVDAEIRKKIAAELNEYKATEKNPLKVQAKEHELLAPFKYSSQLELGRDLLTQGPLGTKPADAVQPPGSRQGNEPLSTEYRLRNVLECSGCHR